MTGEEIRLAHEAAQVQGSPSADAHADREARMAADIATMEAGPTEHAASQTDHHLGLPSIDEQMATHGAAPPARPDIY